MKAEIRVQLRQLWTERIAEWQKSGLSQTEWSQLHNLNHHQFGYWKRKLCPPLPLKKERGTFIPIVTQPQPAAPVPVTFYLSSGIRVEALPEQAIVLIKSLQETV